ncbi:MAG: AAA family ATPase [Desulfurococcus sp.]|uniref:AAA family ATPase n=1 Tax=Desulfurococcus sp. TaxID=51678 RepID=UPI003D10A3F1
MASTSPSQVRPSDPQAGGLEPGGRAGQPQDVSRVRERILKLERTLNDIVIGHEDAVRALILASVAGEHAVLIGPPGVAKSYLVKTFAKLVNARYYQYLLTKFTSYDELFGSIDVVALTRGEYRRNWSRIITADIIFLDEIFKANSAILNALLSLLQERVVYDPMTGSEIQASLHTAVGASNETPEDPELMALYDRFALRVFMNYLMDDVSIFRALSRALETKWVDGNKLEPIMSINDLKVMNSYAISLLRSTIKGVGDVWKVYHTTFLPFYKTFRNKGVIVSDRTIIEKMPKIFAAYLAVYGVTLDNIMNAPFELLPLTAHSRQEAIEIKKAMDESLGEVAELARKLEEAKKHIRAYDFKTAKDKLVDILNYDVNRLASKPWLKPRVEAILSSAREYLQRIEEVIQQLKVEE